MLLENISWIVFILLLKNEENIKDLFWKVILQLPNNLTCKISVLVSTFCDLLYSQLIDRKNCISEYSKIKKCIPKDYLKFLKNENNDIENKILTISFKVYQFAWNEKHFH
jgi:hypothetical protein